MVKRRLPIGMQTFRELRERDCYYVDKTAYIKRLLDEGKQYFLSRPRRFGKSLFLDTLKELFEGSEELFAGLHVHQRHDWTERHPVVRLSFGGGNFKEPANLDASVMAQLEGVAEQAGVSARYATAPERFAHLIRTLHAHAGQRVAVLVDEYDKPILDALVEKPEIARANRDYLLSHLVQDPARQTENSMRLARLLEAHDCAGLRELFHAFFASIPYQRYAAGRCRRTNNDIANYEGFYASVFYSYFAALGYEIAVEESSSHGRLDMAVRAGGQVYLFEFKVVELAPPGSALRQLQERDYAAKYRGEGQPIPMGVSRPSSEAAGLGEGQPIHLIGVEFSRDTRNVTAFEVAPG